MRLEHPKRCWLGVAVFGVIVLSGCGESAFPDDMTTIRIYAREYQWCAVNQRHETSLDDCAMQRLAKSLSASGLVAPPHLADLVAIWREVAYLTQVQGWSQAMADAVLERRLEHLAK